MLPARMYRVLRRLIHTRRLNRTPAMAVDVSPLPKASQISLSDTFRGDGAADGWERARTSMNEVLKNMPAHAMDPADCRAIYRLIRRLQPRSVLEIGTNGGASTIHAAMAMREYRHTGRPPRLVTLDMFDVNNLASVEAKRYRICAPPREMLAQLDCVDMVEFVVARSTDYLHGCETEFDFILLDHAPAADIAYRDIVLAIKALRPGGHLFIHCYPLDNNSLPSTERVGSDPYRAAVSHLRRQGAPLVVLPLAALSGSTKPNGANVTSATLLARE